MNRLFLIAGLGLLVACNNNDSTSTNVEGDTTEHAASATYQASEGDVSYRNSKVVVYRNGDWVETNEDVTLDDGVIVRRDGRVVRDGDEVELREGEVVTRSGRFFDRAGNAIEDAWDATKRGVKKAGKEIEEGVEKVFE